MDQDDTGGRAPASRHDHDTVQIGTVTREGDRTISRMRRTRDQYQPDRQDVPPE